MPPPGTEWLQRQRNYQQALHELKMTPQEQYAYQHHLRNLARGGVRQPNGDISTYLSKTFTFGNRAYVLPSVWDNKIITDNQEIIRRAREVGLDKWPSYGSVDEAEKRYNVLHGYMERDTGAMIRAPSIRQPAGPPDGRELDQGGQPAITPGLDR